VQVNLEIPGTHGELYFSGGWPDADMLAEHAEAVAETFRRCPCCRDVPAREVLLAMAKAAPADLAAELREVAGESREPGPAELALADAYLRHGEGLAELDDAYADDSWRTWT
jgi:hypothetical protein